MKKVFFMLILILAGFSAKSQDSLFAKKDPIVFLDSAVIKSEEVYTGVAAFISNSIFTPTAEVIVQVFVGIHIYAGTSIQGYFLGKVISPPPVKEVKIFSEDIKTPEGQKFVPIQIINMKGQIIKEMTTSGLYFLRQGEKVKKVMKIN